MNYIKYTVQAGDTLGKIADQYLNNAALYPVIMDQNNRPLANPNDIKVGQVLHIPNLDVFAEYTVKAGDTLANIAREMLGQASLYTVILNGDGTVISNPNSIKVGQALRIPMDMRAAGRTLKLSALQNMSYTGLGVGTTITLTNGEFSGKTNAIDAVEARLLHHRFGDLTRNGEEDAAVIMWHKTVRTTGRFLSLVAVVQKGNKLADVATEYIADRAQIKEFSLSSGQVTIKYTEVPTGGDKVVRYRLQGSQWVSV